MSTERVSSNSIKFSLAGALLRPVSVQIFIIFVPVLMAGWGVGVLTGELADLVFGSISDAYIQVSTFVAATLLLFYGIEKIFKIDAGEVLSRHTFWQVPLAAGLGALPGCGGAIIVLTQYVSGRLSFGSVVAVLTATMGDAAFLLISQMPITGLAMMVTGFVVGSLSGWLVDLIHSPEFLYEAKLKDNKRWAARRENASSFVDRIWLALFIPGLCLASLVAFQVDVDALFATSFCEKPATTIGVVGGSLALMMQLGPRLGCLGDANFSKTGTVFRKTIRETNFVTLWVVSAYLAFELAVYFFGLDLKSIFGGWAVMTPLISVVVGFLPGCGPQILITTMYIAGYIPLSAQIGNAISNDGDALFPAIAMAPKVAIVATLYSAIPALIFSYIYFFSFEYY
ncbi:MAG: hypothetical protein CMM58_12945 [Rhodospirillaceae bacterium]|nr:hypothetical protein [Rhodospirillaceae bacterium]